MLALRGLLDLLFPPACQVCRSPGASSLCTECRDGFTLIRPPVCARCGIPLRGPEDLVFTCISCRHRRWSFAAARAAGIYDGALRESVHALKFRRRRALAEPLGELLASAAADPVFRNVNLIVPVPLHPRRVRERGFNQSELLAAVVARRLGLDVDATGFRRLRSTPPQTGLDSEARRANIREAFVAVRRFHNKKIVLVDDVISTGSTVRECARALRAAGAGEIVVLALARSLPR